jgi:hypothetical protein
MKNLMLVTAISLLFVSCEPENHQADINQILSLEKQWFTDEFSADTASISSLLDDSFICVSPDTVFTKQQILKQFVNNYAFRKTRSIVIDSFLIENPVIHFYDNTAVVTFNDHTYAHVREKAVDTNVMFCDVWVKFEDGWRAVSSQGHY